MDIKTLAIGSIAVGAVVGAGARLALDDHFDDKRHAATSTRDAAQHRLDTETLDPATRATLQRQADTRVPWTPSPPIALAAGVTGFGFAFGMQMAEMGGGFATGWAKPNAVTGGLTAGLLGGLLVANLIDRD